MLNTITSVISSALLIFNTPSNAVLATSSAYPLYSAENSVISVNKPSVLSSQTYSLENRYTNSFVNDVFSDNILLTLAYMTGEVKKGDKIDWDKVRAPQEFFFTLNPGQTFAFHDTVLPEYQTSVVSTTRAHFSSDEGFKSDGYLVGDGVCHLASFINVVASAAGLKVVSPTNHNFAKIADVPKEYGVSIYVTPDSSSKSARENLYITNTLDKPVIFMFNHDKNALTLTVKETS